MMERQDDYVFIMLWVCWENIMHTRRYLQDEKQPHQHGKCLHIIPTRKTLWDFPRSRRPYTNNIIWSIKVTQYHLHLVVKCEANMYFWSQHYAYCSCCPTQEFGHLQTEKKSGPMFIRDRHLSPSDDKKASEVSVSEILASEIFVKFG